jgi:hypothetical protein
MIKEITAMKVLLVIGLALWATVSFASHTTRAQERQKSASVKQKANGLEVSLVADKRRYRQGEQIKLQAMLFNSDNDKDVFVYGTLEWGYSASFTLHVRDARGKDVQSRFLDDALTPPLPPDDRSPFVKLLPHHFLGTYYYSTLHELNIQRPGRYSLFVEYHSPISTAEVDLKPFLSKENGTIKSNVVWIEVL